MTEDILEIPGEQGPAPDWRERHGPILRTILIGGGTIVLAIMLLVGVTLYVFSRDPRNRRLAEGLVFDSLETEAASGATPGPERTELSAAYARFRKDWSDERISESDGDAVRRKLMEMIRHDPVSADEIRGLARRLDAVARTAPKAGR